MQKIVHFKIIIIPYIYRDIIRVVENFSFCYCAGYYIEVVM